MKKIIIGLVIITGICVFAAATTKTDKNYANNSATTKDPDVNLVEYNPGVAIVNEQGVVLGDYTPFMKNTKAVKLGEPSTLKLDGDLPKIDGATAFYPLYAAFVQATYPEKPAKDYYYLYNESPVKCTTTIGAYKRLIEGEADIIFCFRPSEEQLKYAQSKGVELKLTPIGREAFVFFVNTNNNVQALSTRQIQDIYSGKITNWQELGGSNESIEAFQRPENSGSQTILQKMMEGKQLMKPLMKKDVIPGMDQIIYRTADYQNHGNAIGYSFLYFATEIVNSNQIRLLAIDGVYPDRNTIRDRKYPLTFEFYAVTAGSKNPNVEPFIQWILSRQGQLIVDKTGYTPI